MFWRKPKPSPVEQSKNPKEESTTTVMSTVLKRELKHTKSILNRKLYDTEKSTKICQTKDHRLLFTTPNGNYFSCDTEYGNYCGKDAIYQVSAIIYSDIRPETEQYAKENIGAYDVDKYIELFGEVEEA